MLGAVLVRGQQRGGRRGIGIGVTDPGRGARKRIRHDGVAVAADKQFGARADEAVDRERGARRVQVVQPAHHVGDHDRTVGRDLDGAGEHDLGERAGIDRRRSRPRPGRTSRRATATASA